MAPPRAPAIAGRRHRWPLLFVSPFFLLFAAFFLYPVAFSLWLSLHETRGIAELRFTGLANFARLFRDAQFWGSMLNAAILFVIYVPVMTAAAVVLASVGEMRQAPSGRIGPHNPIASPYPITHVRPGEGPGV